MIDVNETLGQVATQHPAATHVFLRHRLDFCCGGAQKFTEACEKAGLDPKAVAAEIAIEAETRPVLRWEEKSVEDIIDFILTRYHAPLWKDLEMLLQAAKRVERVHGNKPSCPRGLAACLEQAGADLMQHLAKEEQLLFPALVAGGRGAQVQMPISVMMQEHDDHGLSLSRLRALTTDYNPPTEACATWRALYSGLKKLESDLMEHIHLENNILFPCVLE
jgi:regulator of cell morphogenesis and NO signaling